MAKQDPRLLGLSLSNFPLLSSLISVSRIHGQNMELKYDGSGAVDCAIPTGNAICKPQRLFTAQSTARGESRAAPVGGHPAEAGMHIRGVEILDWADTGSFHTLENESLVLSGFPSRVLHHRWDSIEDSRSGVPEGRILGPSSWAVSFSRCRAGPEPVE